MGDIVRSPEIRTAAQGDAPTLARLRFQFRSELGELVETEEEFVARCTRWMEDRLGRDFPWRCWVAEGPDGIVGNLWLQVMEKLPNPVEEPELHAYITNVYVLPDCRSAGVGALLLEAALEWCRSSKIDAVFLWPSDRSRPFYMRYGFSVRDDLFALRPVSP
ncbi:MAG TPA: GNAT family N-acetyltransferase [Thermoanaerobaculia bacterium]|nr:GNAT family N-acetyltransferase [Thermoanaerobaculia bacterium]